jgi:hypothetical protein
MPRRRTRHAKTETVKPAHHAQARISEDTRYALAKLAQERNMPESEIVRDALEVYLFGAQQGASFTGPDHGYRIAKSSAGVIARQALHKALAELPDSFEEWRAQADQIEAEES